MAQRFWSRGGKGALPNQPRPSIAGSLLRGWNDYIILKPKQSAFYSTPLEILLDYLNLRRVVPGGISADQCIFFTAQDAARHGGR
jgi:nicotinamidase-related amidase